MNVHRFTGSSARDALTQVREALGPDAMILSNRSVAEGVEILACGMRDFAAIIQDKVLPIPTGHPAVEAPRSENLDSNSVQNLMTEIRDLRDSLENQLAELTWTGQQKKDPHTSSTLKELLAIGFSPSLARYLTEHAPAHLTLEARMDWAQQTLSRNLQVLPDEMDFLDKGGVYALVGPTGVGKTTSTAKLAARCVMRHGASKLALITTDAYRIGAHEQLRIYGKILGVMVHSVKDDIDLRIALEELKNKHTVLIDTVGMSQRDQMVAEQIAMLSETPIPVKRLLCLNTASTLDTLNEVVQAYRGSGLEGCILTKLDEAATLGGAIDLVLRQNLKLYYIGTGQRVPEDLQVPNPQELVARAFKSRKDRTSTRYKDDELVTVMGSKQTRDDPTVRGIHVG
jgi:flagellar biosynthesis protein FlhF